MTEQSGFGALALRALLVLTGLAVAASGLIALGDGRVMLGIPGRNLQSTSLVVQVDTWPEVLLTGLALGVIASLLTLAGVAPRRFHNSALVPALVLLSFVLLVCVPLVVAGP